MEHSVLTILRTHWTSLHFEMVFCSQNLASTKNKKEKTENIFLLSAKCQQALDVCNSEPLALRSPEWFGSCVDASLLDMVLQVGETELLLLAQPLQL